MSPGPSSSSSGLGLLRSMSPRSTAAAIIGALALVFIFQNTKRAKVRLLFWTIEAPGWIWLFSLLLIGGAIGYVVARRRANRS